MSTNKNLVSRNSSTSTAKRYGLGTSNTNLNSNKNNNTVNSNNNTGVTSGVVKTNTSYNGSYLSPNLDTDYQAKINEAVAKGDYNSASQYEALRNSKINYLNSINSNKNNYSTTSNYTNNYSNNSQNGSSYISKYKSFFDLPDNWSIANVNGSVYKKENGLISQNTGNTNGVSNYKSVGNSINEDTGEWKFDDYESAKKAAYDNYLSAIGGSQFKDLETAYKYLDDNNVLSTDYINRVMNGTNGQYNQKLADEALKQQTISNYSNSYNKLNDEQKSTIDNNSFEVDYRYDEYYDYMKGLENKSRTGVI